MGIHIGDNNNIKSSKIIDKSNQQKAGFWESVFSNTIVNIICWIAGALGLGTIIMQLIK